MKTKNIIKLLSISIGILIFTAFIYIFINESSMFYKKNYQVWCDNFLTKNELEIWKSINENTILELENINWWWINYNSSQCNWKYWLEIQYLSVWEYKNTIKLIWVWKTINGIPYKIVKYKN